jgi:hypothetical protein
MSKNRTNGVHLNNLREWLSKNTTDKIRPSLVVNSGYNLAVLVVDFGAGLESVKLETDQFSEFTKLMKAATKEVTGRDVSVRMSVDNGIHWTSI